MALEEIRHGERPCDVAARLVSLGLAAALAAVVLQTAGHLSNSFLLDGGYAELDATRDAGPFTWMSSVATFAAAFAAGIGALLYSRRRFELALLAALLAFLSLDDAVQAHEGLEHAGALVFLAAYFPLLGGALLLLARAARDAPGRAGASIAAGLALLVASIGVRVVGGVATVLGGVPDWIRVVGEAAMQDAKLGGWILVAAGMTASVCFLLVATEPRS
jgi:hypothetical protein